tara:strand:- start:487 stop:759 length:273 start_codon:yes stop_codon:yes gene_type:complete
MKSVKTHFMRKNGMYQHRLALITKQGNKWTHLIFIDYPIHVERVPNKVAEDFVEYKDTRGTVRQLQHMAKIWFGRKSNAPKNVQSALWGA